MRTSTHLTLPFFCAVLMAACSGNENYPKDYIGFEQRILEHTYDVNHEEETITLKIVAGEKQNKDRKMTVSSPQHVNTFKIKDPNPILLKGKKSVKIDVIVYPQRFTWGQGIIRLVCTPDGKDAKNSEISIRLQKK